MREYNVYEFIDLVRSEPNKWIHYCEIIITYNGKIILARPSHEESVIQYAMEVEGKSREDILEELRKNYLSPLGFYVDKYKLIAVWYDYLRVSGSQKLNRFQEHTLKILSDYKLIAIRNMDMTLEYNNYLARNLIEGIDHV